MQYRSSCSKKVIRHGSRNHFYRPLSVALSLSAIYTPLQHACMLARRIAIWEGWNQTSRGFGAKGVLKPSPNRPKYASFPFPKEPFYG